MITIGDRGDDQGPAHPVTKPFPLSGLVGESGLLWAINRYVFHPRGFALAVQMESGELELWGDGTETWTFSDEVDDGGMEAFEGTLARLKRAWADIELEDVRPNEDRQA